ncbi:major histocompatibility complex class I-related protein 1-like [Festucalex cinctus]
MMMISLFVSFVAALQIHSVVPTIHTLIYFTTTSSQVAKLPEYWSAAYVDDIQILHYDSNSRKMKAKQDWVNKITADDPHFWKREKEITIGNEQVSKVNIELLKETLNQTGGVHMFQVMGGCEWDDETAEVDGWLHHSYDGEDFISFEAKTMRWIIANQQASITKNLWDQRDGFNHYWKNVLNEVCPNLLKKHVSNGRDFLMRTELPTVSLLQKTPSSPVTCHATGFYPRASALFWRKDGEEIHEDVEIGETLPNHDGTFQTTAHLKVEVTPDVEGKYECVFQLSGVKEDIVTKLERRSILSNARIQEEEYKKKVVAITVPLVVLGLVVVLMVVLAKRYRTRQARAEQEGGAGLPESRARLQPHLHEISNRPAS